jgi:hypothetical protein
MACLIPPVPLAPQLLRPKARINPLSALFLIHLTHIDNKWASQQQSLTQQPLLHNTYFTMKLTIVSCSRLWSPSSLLLVIGSRRAPASAPRASAVTTRARRSAVSVIWERHPDLSADLALLTVAADISCRVFGHPPAICLCLRRLTKRYRRWLSSRDGHLGAHLTPYKPLHLPSSPSLLQQSRALISHTHRISNSFKQQHHLAPP